MDFARRTIVAGAGLLPAMAVTGCGGGGSSIASLLGVGQSSAQNSVLKLSVDAAMPTLASTSGFYNTAVAKVALPIQLAGQGGGSVVDAKIGNVDYREALVQLVNNASQKGAQAAAPLIDSAVPTIPDAQASASNPAPSTEALRQAVGASLTAPTRAAIEAALAELGAPLLAEALAQVIGIDHSLFVDDITAKAIAGMFGAIGREEMVRRGMPVPA